MTNSPEPVHAFDHHFSTHNLDNRALCGQFNPTQYAVTYDELHRVTCMGCREQVLNTVQRWS